MTVMMTKKSSVDRVDAIDCVIFCCVPVYFWLGTWATTDQHFPQGHAVVLLSVILLLKGSKIAEVKRPLQCLSGAFACLVTAGLVSALPIQSPVFRIFGPVIFFFGGFHFTRWFMLFALDLAAGPPEQDKELYRIFQTPYYLAAGLTFLQGLLVLWEDTDLTLLFSFPWIAPFALMYFSIRRLAASSVLSYMATPRAWRRVCGERSTIFAVSFAIAYGFVVGFMFQRPPIVWVPFSIIIAFQGLIFLRLLSWTSTADSPNSGFQANEAKGAASR